MVKKISKLQVEIEVPKRCSRTVSQLKTQISTDEFMEEFEKSEKMILETDKCEVEIYTIEDLYDILQTFSEKDINNIEWEFVK